MIELKPFVQKYDFDCGPASTKMVLNYYGKNESYEKIIKGCGCSRKIKEGAEGEDIAKYLTKMGIPHAHKLYGDLEELIDFVNLGYPVIVGWFSPSPGSHWSVAVSITEKRFILQDPAIGKKRYMSLGDFEEVWFSVDARMDEHTVQKSPIERSLNLREMIYPLNTEV